MFPQTIRLALVGLVALPLLNACAPETVIRRSAFIPGASSPDRVGGELFDGEVRLAGHINAIRANSDSVVLDDLFTLPGDPGVFIPNFQLGGSAYFGLGNGFELGGQFSFASLSWASRNTPGVLDFPAGKEENLLMGGVGARYNFQIEHPAIRLAVLGELNFVDVPQAVFVLESGTYNFERMDHDSFALPNLALQLGWEAALEGMDYVEPYVMLGVQRSVTNVGFDDQIANLDDSTLEGFYAGYLGFGIDARFSNLVVGANLYLPFESVERIDFGPNFSFTLGGVFGSAHAEGLNPTEDD